MKDSLVKLRLSEETHALWRKAAAEQGHSTLSQFVRSAVGAAICRQPYLSPDELDEIDRLREEVRRIGVNLNVMARELHAARRQPEADALSALVEETGRASKELRAIIEARWRAAQ